MSQQHLLGPDLVAEGLTKIEANFNDIYAGGFVTSTRLGSGAVTFGKIGANAVSQSTIVDGAVTLAKLAPQSVDNSKRVNAANFVSTYGVVGDGTDESSKLQAAISAVSLLDDRRLFFDQAGKTITFGTMLQVNAGIRFLGIGATRPTLAPGTQLKYTGNAAAIQLGTDNGHAYDANEYDGLGAYCEFHNLSLLGASNTQTALVNAQGSYSTNSYGIRDWRGGELVLNNVWIENFQYGFWGIQSDINSWSFVHLYRNKVGAYLGPRSDQNTIDRLYTLFNDVALHLDRVTGTRIRDCQFVGDGSASTYPVVVGSAYSQGSRKTTFTDCWFEHYQGAASIVAYVAIGVGDSVQTQGTKFRDCTLWTNVQGGGSGPYAQYFLDIGNADRIVIDDPEGDTGSLSKLIHFVSGSAQVKVESTTQLNTSFLNSGVGTPSISRWSWGNSSGVPSNQIASGTTAQRPSSPNTVQPYWDTTLGKPVWWNGAAWKDATGATV